MANSELDKLAQPTEQTVNINVTIQEFNAILGALQELPHRVVDALLKKIFTQAQEQLQGNQPKQPN